MKIAAIFLAILILSLETKNYSDQSPLNFLNEYLFYGGGYDHVTSFNPQTQKTTTIYTPENLTDIHAMLIANDTAYLWVSQTKEGLTVSENVLVFDQDFKIIKKISNLPAEVREFSDDGHYGLTNNSPKMQGPEGLGHYLVVFEVKPSSNPLPIVKNTDLSIGEFMFLKDNRTVIYMTLDHILWKFNIPTRKKEKIYKFSNEDLILEDVAHNHPWILCCDWQAFYIFDYEKKELKLIKRYDEPGFPAIVKKIDGRAELVSGGSWFEGDKGFFFCKQNNSVFNFFPSCIFSPLVFRVGELYYFDLETKQDYFVSSTWYGTQWRKKPPKKSQVTGENH